MDDNTATALFVMLLIALFIIGLVLASKSAGSGPAVTVPFLESVKSDVFTPTHLA